LVGGLKAYQTRAWLLNVEDNIDNHDRDDRGTEDVKPTPVMPNSRPIASQ
jgi:hypothetical protein